jgi:hypothetical protein
MRYACEGRERGGRPPREAGGAPPALPLPWHRWNGHFDRAIYHVPRPQSEPRFGCETIFWMQYSHHQVGRIHHHNPWVPMIPGRGRVRARVIIRCVRANANVVAHVGALRSPPAPIIALRWSQSEFCPLACCLATLRPGQRQTRAVCGLTTVAGYPQCNRNQLNGSGLK